MYLQVALHWSGQNEEQNWTVSVAAQRRLLKCLCNFEAIKEETLQVYF